MYLTSFYLKFFDVRKLNTINKQLSLINFLTKKFDFNLLDCLMFKITHNLVLSLKSK